MLIITEDKVLINWDNIIAVYTKYKEIDNVYILVAMCNDNHHMRLVSCKNEDEAERLKNILINECLNNSKIVTFNKTINLK